MEQLTAKNLNNNPIIFAYGFNENGRSQNLENSQIAAELENSNLAWVHLDASEEQFETAKNWLEKNVAYLDHLIIDALLTNEARPRLIEFENGLLIILRGLNLKEKSRPEDMVSIRIWIDELRIITIQRREMQAIFDFKNIIDGGKKVKNSSEFLYNILYQILAEISNLLLDISDETDDLEKILKLKGKEKEL